MQVRRQDDKAGQWQSRCGKWEEMCTCVEHPGDVESRKNLRTSGGQVENGIVMAIY